jgi:ATP-binding cassette subfamily C protein LapB
MRQALLLFLRANRRHLAELMLATLCINVTALSLPLFSMLVYDKAVGNQVHDTLWALAIGTALVLALELSLRASRMLMVEHASSRWDAFLDQRLMRGVIHAPHDKALSTGQVVARAREVAATRDALSAHSLLTLADLPFVALLGAALYVVAGPLVAIPLVLGLLLIVATTVMQRLAEGRHREAHRATRDKLTVLVDVLQCRSQLGGTRREEQAQQLFQTHALAGARAATRARIWQQWPAQLSPFFIGLGSVAVMVGGVYLVEARQLSMGGLISANLLAVRLLSTLVTVAPLLGRIREFRQALDGLARTVNLESDAQAALERAPAALSSEGLRLDQLSLRYPEAGQSALQGMTVHLRPGELVAVVGSCGGGKSTLLKLLAGQARHAEGRLSVGGQVIEDDSSRRWLRAQVHLKPQEPGFWGGTVRDIVGGGDTRIDDNALTRALREAGLGPALDRGELGLNTVVGSQGLGLSGGEKQSLSLAQAFASSAPVLLFDEPTLGLDRPAQERVLETLSRLAQGQPFVAAEASNEAPGAIAASVPGEASNDADHQGGDAASPAEPDEAPERPSVAATPRCVLAATPRCVLVATHAAEVIQRAQRVLVLDRGRLVADGRPDRLFSAAAHAPVRKAAHAIEPQGVKA